MPTDQEFSSNHVTWPLSQKLVVNTEDLARAVVSPFAAPDAGKRETTDAEALDEIEEVYKRYSRADQRFHMLRRDLPFPVYLLVQVGCAAAHGCGLPSIAERLERLARESNKIFLRASRQSKYGIAIARPE
jgi:hypothetical protein